MILFSCHLYPRPEWPAYPYSLIMDFAVALQNRRTFKTYPKRKLCSDRAGLQADLGQYVGHMPL